MGTFIAGLDDDYQGVFQRILDFCIEYQVDWALAFIMAPYPGRESFTRLKRERRILCENRGKYDSLHAVYQPLLISPFLFSHEFKISPINKKMIK